MNIKPMLLLTVIVSIIIAGNGKSQEIGQAGQGYELAQRLCAQCHAIQKNHGTSPNENAPSFQAIASVPGMTAFALSVSLNSPHRSMPNIILEANERTNIIAYILSLKKL